MTSFHVTRPLAALMLCGAASALAQVSLTPQRYFECQISARYATVVGLEERLKLVSANTASIRAAHSAADERSRNRVSQAFASCGFSAGALGAYAHRNADQLEAWLSANPAVRSRLDAMGARVASLSAQMPAVSPSAKR